MEDVQRFIEKQVKEIKETVGKEKAVCALSGGVDSSVTAALAHKAIGNQLEAIFIDDGLMRENEGGKVREVFKIVGIGVKIADVQKDFFAALEGKTDPEEKRKAFRDCFYKTLGKLVKESRAKFMLQGTIKADIIETKKGVKTQHNVLEQIGVNPQEYGLKILEPLKELFKPDVRAIGKALGLPEQIYNRMPFPGPALATRCLGECTPERIAIVRKAHTIVEEEIAKAGLKPFQAFAVLLNDKATGLNADGSRRFGHIIVIRSVESTDAMAAKATPIQWEVLQKMQERVSKEIDGVARVLYELTGKPPATIEYI